MMAKPIHRKIKTTHVLPEASISAKNKPNIAEMMHTAIDVVLRPNFSANTADKGIKAAKHKVANS